VSGEVGSNPGGKRHNGWNMAQVAGGASNQLTVGALNPAPRRFPGRPAMLIDRADPQASDVRNGAVIRRLRVRKKAARAGVTAASKASKLDRDQALVVVQRQVAIPEPRASRARRRQHQPTGVGVQGADEFHPSGWERRQRSSMESASPAPRQRACRFRRHGD